MEQKTNGFGIASMVIGLIIAGASMFDGLNKYVEKSQEYSYIINCVGQYL